LNYLGIKPYSYSYEFEKSFPEASYGKKIAEIYKWNFEKYLIPKSYLWNQIDSIAKANQCYAEFTNARQASVVEEISTKGKIWLLGHWGDVLFDDMGVPDNLSTAEEKKIIKKKIKREGADLLATAFWNHHNLYGTFDEYFNEKVDQMHSKIGLSNSNASIRAFKSLYWATRWTSTNLVYFSQFHPIQLPYYDDRMCRFIMKIPEEYLASRKIQIAYLKKYAPELARLTWQDKAPYNLYNYHRHRSIYHLPYRVLNKLNRELKSLAGRGIQTRRNWEIQFLGEQNRKSMMTFFDSIPANNELFNNELLEKIINGFYEEDHKRYSHSLSMLITLSSFLKIRNS